MECVWLISRKKTLKQINQPKLVNINPIINKTNNNMARLPRKKKKAKGKCLVEAHMFASFQISNSSFQCGANGKDLTQGSWLRLGTFQH